MTDMTDRILSRCNCNIETSPCGSENDCRFDISVAARITSLQDRVKELETPQFCWDYGGECGYANLEDFADSTGETAVVFQASEGRTLWTGYVAAVYDGAWKLEKFDTEEEAEAALGVNGQTEDGK